MKLTKTWLIGAAVSAAITISGTALAQERARVLTSPTGSIVNTTGSAIASVVSKNTDLTLLAIPLAGPQVYVPQLANGQGEFTLLNAADAYNAVRGVKPAYQTAYPDLRLAAVGFTNELGIITRKDSDIKSGQDLKGRRVTGVYSAHKTCEQLATAQLANLGLTWDDVKVVPVTHAKTAVQALADGRAEAALCVPIGIPIVQEVNAQTPIRFVSLDDSKEAVARTRKLFPAGKIRHYDAGSGVGVVDPVNVWSYPFYLIAHKDASPELVHKVVKTVSENVDDLRAVSGVFKRWTPEGMVDEDITLPVHEGAKRYYKEQGLWTDAVENAHQTQLKEIQ